MDELIIRELDGRTTPEELEELAGWRSTSEESERRYEDIRALWALTGMRRELDPILEAPSAAEILESTTEPSVRTWPGRPLVRRAVAVAAAVIMGFAVGHLGQGRLAPEATVHSEFRTGPNELLTAVLEDGSVARLGPNTTLRVTMGEGARQGELNGRAFFAVARDPSRPFGLQTPEGEVTVLGTRFEVDTGRSSLRLLVVDGLVALSSGGTQTKLRAGDLGEASRGRVPSITRVEVPEALLDWMGTWMAFEATPLHRVAKELEVRLGIQVEIADPAIADRTFSGWFSEQDRDQMLTMICRVAELRCTQLEDRVLMEDWT